MGGLGSFGVDLVPGRIRFLVVGGRFLVVDGVVGLGARWVLRPSQVMMLLVRRGLWAVGVGWPGARTLLRSVCRGIPRPTKGHQGDQHHARPRDHDPRADKGAHGPTQGPQGRTSNRETKLRPAPWPKSPCDGQATT